MASMANITKRERTQNWSLKEKQLLLKLMEEQLPVLETRRTDQQSIKTKTHAWELLRQQFVETLGIERDLNRIREQWRRMKGQARTELIDYADRVKNLGKEQADQRQPTKLTKEVWRVMELAKQFIHNTDDNHEDVIKQEINWSLSNGLIQPDCPSDADAERSASPRFLCETEVKQEFSDSEKDNYKDDDSSYDPLISDQKGIDSTEQNDMLPNKSVYLKLANHEEFLTVNKLKRPTTDDIYTILLQDKRREHLKRMQMLEYEIQTSNIIKETAEINKQIAQQTLKRLLILNTSTKDSAKCGLNQLNDPSNGKNNNNTSHEISETFNKRETNRDEDLFHKQQQIQLKKLKEELTLEITFHEEQIRRHQEAISRHKERVQSIEENN